ncbi:hypothetical protein HHL22_16130 [Hymenobacter sp. RP-2-7]|uniref:Uncharacterized protein n=1 Tax=Hymenobacter polaris TaxID=2682546 RepID=A0A7Y0AGF6_9BACT|nr:hypothetical protein [Hymenobacter polaris]NML66737.1 hypothetical protein [Hymenobacter polaris]
MPARLNKWLLRFSVTGAFLLALLVLIVFAPALSYAQQSSFGRFTVYHQQPLAVALPAHLAAAAAQLRGSELYTPDFHADICLNDQGSSYPKLLGQLLPPAFAWGFADKVVLQGQANFAADYVELHGYRWNSTALLTHELTHCLQAQALGWYRSNSLTGYPTWKREGYAEYLARPHGTPAQLAASLARLHQAEFEQPTAWEVLLPDGTMQPKDYAHYAALVTYCLDVQHQTYRQLLADTLGEATVARRMAAWEGGRKGGE